VSSKRIHQSALMEIYRCNSIPITYSDSTVISLSVSVVSFSFWMYHGICCRGKIYEKGRDSLPWSKQSGSQIQYTLQYICDFGLTETQLLRIWWSQPSSRVSGMVFPSYNKYVHLYYTPFMVVWIWVRFLFKQNIKPSLFFKFYFYIDRIMNTILRWKMTKYLNSFNKYFMYF
jgi:hypothetical protein